MSGIVGGLNLRSSGLVNISSATDGQAFTGTGAGLPVGFEAVSAGTNNASSLFSAYLTSSATSAIGGGTVYNITATAWTQIEDEGSDDFNASNGTFTAPTTGFYYLSAYIQLGGIDAAHTYFQAYIVTNDRTHLFDHADLDSGHPATTSSSGSAVLSMDAGHTAHLRYTLTGSSTGTANINGGIGGTFFSGFLIG